MQYLQMFGVRSPSLIEFDRSPMACTETSNASKFYGLFMLFIILSLFLSLVLSLSFSLSRTFCHIKFALVFARSAIMFRAFEKSVAKMSCTADFARYSSKLSNRRFFFYVAKINVSRIISWKLHLISKQITFYRARINYCILRLEHYNFLKFFKILFT